MWLCWMITRLTQHLEPKGLLWLLVVLMGGGLLTWLIQLVHKGIHPSLADWEKKAQRQPNNSKIHYSLGEKYTQLGRFQEACQAFQTSLRLNPEYAEANLQLGRCYLEIQKPHLAVSALERAVKINPQLFEAHYFLGQIWMLQLGETQKAIDAFKTTLRLNPSHIPASLSLGNIYLAQDNYPQALKTFRRATRNHPRNVLAHIHLGRTYLIMGDYERALQEQHILETLDHKQSLALLAHIQRARAARYN